MNDSRKRKRLHNDSPKHSVLKTTISSQKYALGNALEYQKAQTFLDVLLLVAYTPLYIHKLQMIITISRTDYEELMLLQHNNRKKRSYEEIIGRRHAKYLFSTNGTIEIFVTSNHSPFKIETDEDEGLLFSFLGQVRDRLLYYVGDVRESYIPSLMDWILVQCDLNKDIEIDDKAQITLPDIQLRHADRVFREYVKIIKDKAFCRVEESVKLNKILPEALDNIRHPFKSLEKKLDDILEYFDEPLNQRIRALTETDHEIKNKQYTPSPTETEGVKNKEGEVS